MDPYQNRRWVIILILLLIGLVFVFRLLFIQVLDQKWKDRARRITHTEKSIQPPRGLIYDRNGKLLVSANQVYDIMITRVVLFPSHDRNAMKRALNYLSFFGFWKLISWSEYFYKLILVIDTNHHVWPFSRVNDL